MCAGRTLMYVQLLFHFENRAGFEIMWKNIEEPGRPQMTIWRMRVACGVPKATDTHSECAILTVFSTASMVAPHCYVVRTSPV